MQIRCAIGPLQALKVCVAQQLRADCCNAFAAHEITSRAVDQACQMMLAVSSMD